MEKWVQSYQFPGYSVSDQGRVRNDDRERILTVRHLPTGHLAVSLTKDGVQVCRSLAKIVASSFVPGYSEIFNTPIHLDGDRKNCWAENLLWRPRWFSFKYHTQFTANIPKHRPLRRTETGEVFGSGWPWVTNEGLLYYQILEAASKGGSVFPTGDHFEFVL